MPEKIFFRQRLRFHDHNQTSLSILQIRQAIFSHTRWDAHQEEITIQAFYRPVVKFLTLYIELLPFVQTSLVPPQFERDTLLWPTGGNKRARSRVHDENERDATRR